MGVSINCRASGLCLLAMMTLPSAGSQLVLPNSLASTEGAASMSGVLAGASASRVMIVLDASVLSAVIPAGCTITGISFRQDNAATTGWPVINTDYFSHEIRLSPSAVAAAGISTTFAANVSGSQTLVRSGLTRLAAGGFGGSQSGTTPESFGPALGFTTNYVYTGGGLCIDLRSPGFTPGLTVDATSASAGMAAIVGSGTTATTGVAANVPVIRISFALTNRSPAHERGGQHIFPLSDYADESVVPIGAAAAPMASSIQTVQFAFDRSTLSPLNPGSELTSLAWRNSSSSLAPFLPISFSFFNVDLGTLTTTPATLSDTITSNYNTFPSGDMRTVRSGSLSVPLGAFKGDPAIGPAPFSFELSLFDHFYWRDTSLLAVLRHGITGSTSVSLNAVRKSQPGYGTSVRSKSGGGAGTLTTPTEDDFPVTRLRADAFVVAPNNAVTLISGQGVITSYTNAPAVLWQTVIDRKLLRAIRPGSIIVSLGHRTFVGSTIEWPVVNIHADDYELSLSSTTRPASDPSTLFADFEGSDRTLVYDNRIDLSANSLLPTGGSLSYRPFGTLVNFQRQYIYKGRGITLTTKRSALLDTNGTTSWPNSTAVVESPAVSIPGMRSIFSANTSSTTGAPVPGFTAHSTRLGYIPSVAVPKALESSEGDFGDAVFYSARTYQQIIAPAELRNLPYDSFITGISFRNSSSSGSADFPSVDTSVSQFDILLGAATVPPESMSTTFASNVGADERSVYSGALTVPERAFPRSPDTSQASPFSWFIPFERPFRYKGGSLVLTIRSSGNAVIYQNVDADSATPATSCRLVANYATSNATSGSFGNPLVVRFSYTTNRICAGDFSNDGQVDDADFVEFALAYDILDCDDPAMPPACPADFNADDVVDDTDFVLFATAYDTLICP